MSSYPGEIYVKKWGFMKPKPTQHSYNLSFFDKSLEGIINKDHSLVQLAGKIDWEGLEKRFHKYYVDTGRRGVNTRLMLGLHLLAYIYNLSEEDACEEWAENPFWQYFCGMKHFRCERPIDRSTMSKFKKRINKEDLEKLLQETLAVANDVGALKSKDVERVAVDTTVQNKAVDRPNEIKLIEDAVHDVARQAKKSGLKLKQNYKRVIRYMAIKASGYAHAGQMKRLKSQLNRMKKILFKQKQRVYNAMENQGKSEEDITEALKDRLHRAKKVIRQKKTDKDKLQVWHAPEVECIGKGKVKNPYEFGCKVSMVSNVNPAKGGHFILSSKAMHGKPYDGHTLKRAIENTENITEREVKRIYADKGYRGHDYPDKWKVFKSGQKRGVVGKSKRELRR
jgi:IS5 family transposase